MAAAQEANKDRNNASLKIWRTVDADENLAAQTAGRLGIPLSAARILSGLELADADEVNRFLYPRLNDLSDPFLLPSMERAATRIWESVDRGETIAVYGDYDADGITGTALLVSVLQKLGAKQVVPFLPNRISEGYGLGIEALNRLVNKCSPDLLITVDCGTGDAEAVRAATEKGIDVIVTDHHEAHQEPCAAYATLNPKLGDLEPLKILAGVGVVFKLCHALLKLGRNGTRARAFETDLREYLELVIIGTIADIVPLTGENRILVKNGLSRLNREETTGLRALKEAAGIKGRLDTYHVAYLLAPRLNAAGRLGSPETALELLMTDNRLRAREIACELDAANRKRQRIEARIKAEAESEISEWFDTSTHFGIVVGRRGWHPGVIGIVASRLAAVYRRPVVVIAFDENGLGKGSCRSIEGYQLLDGLTECAEHLIAFGGHEMAAGLEIRQDQFEPFKAAFDREAARKLRDIDLRPVQPVNAWIGLDDINAALLDCVERFCPFGQDNPRPAFAARRLRVEGNPRKIGRDHLRMTLASNGVAFSAIAFGMAERALPDGPIDAVFHLQRQYQSDGRGIELNIRDWRAAEHE